MMRNIFISLILICSLSANSQTAGYLRKLKMVTPNQTWNVIIHPASDTVTRKTPFFVFVGGDGEVGTDTSQAIKYSPNYNFRRGFAGTPEGDTCTYIIIQPLTQAYTPIVWSRALDSLYKWMPYLDSSKAYWTGLSYGGVVTSNMTKSTSGFPWWRMTSVIVMSEGNSGVGDSSLIRSYGRIGGFFYGLIGNSDSVGRRQTWKDYKAITSEKASAGLFYVWTHNAGGHDNWDVEYDFRTKRIDGKNIYQIALEHTKNPSASAQSIINTPSSNIILNGVTSGWDKKILWTKVSGSSATITSPTSDTTSVTGLSSGTYIFRLTVTNGTSVTKAIHNVTVNIGATDNRYVRPRFKKWKVN